MPTLPLLPLIYILHSGNLYGTEQMALATVQGLRHQFHPVLLAPPGPVHAVAQQMGLSIHEFSSPLELAKQVLPVFRSHQEVKVIATGVSQSLVAHMLGNVFGTRMTHLHIVHGGTDERLSYGRKALLKHLPVELVAVSAFVKQRLVAHGCLPERVHVIENFQTHPASAVRPAFRAPGIHRVAVISRTDPIKRVGMVLEALARYPHLQSLHIEVFGAGSDFDLLKAQSREFSNLTLHGFVPNASHLLSQFDLLLHTCAEEPFGLAILEAMAAHVPVLAPNAGGAGSLIDNEITGFLFPANDSHGLARVLARLQSESADTLNRVVDAAASTLKTRFSPERGLKQYLALLETPA
jgi:glycosyltransferase involved in cell wall biosynthesis